MMKKGILLLGQQKDPHIISISKELLNLNENYQIIHDVSIFDSFSVNFEGITHGIIKINNKNIVMDNIKSVWNSSPLNLRINKKLEKESLNFVFLEWKEGINSLWNSSHANWVNHPDSIHNIFNRLKQLQLAHKLGLSTPQTLITNDSNTFLKFYKDCEENVIAKTLHSSKGLGQGKMILTTKMTKEDLKHSRDLYYAPCVFQQYIPKKTEYRITIIGQNIHAVEIYSQNSSKTKDDWRNYDDFSKTPYDRISLPSDIEEKLLKLLKITKLKFCTVDMIKTPKDDLIFLELNPSGRWWWIQELTGITISKDIAKYLAQG